LTALQSDRIGVRQSPYLVRLARSCRGHVGSGTTNEGTARSANGANCYRR
jgi:hypothetical protein